jgi:hypothetical protein
MPTTHHVDLDLRGVVLPESRTARPWDVGGQPGTWVLTLVRHRY